MTIAILAVLPKVSALLPGCATGLGYQVIYVGHFLYGLSGSDPHIYFSDLDPSGTTCIEKGA